MLQCLPVPDAQTNGNQIGKEFMVAGKANFTIAIPQEFQANYNVPVPHYTYKIRFKKGEGSYKDTYFVSLLTGPDNWKNYTYLGLLDPNTGDVKLTQASKFQENAWPVRIIRRVLARLWAGEGDVIRANGWKVLHSNKCGRCGRKLTVPESIETGVGPECAKIVFGY